MSSGGEGNYERMCKRQAKPMLLHVLLHAVTSQDIPQMERLHFVD